jgi:hypothetical protein
VECRYEPRWTSGFNAVVMQVQCGMEKSPRTKKKEHDGVEKKNHLCEIRFEIESGYNSRNVNNRRRSREKKFESSYTMMQRRWIGKGRHREKERQRERERGRERKKNEGKCG